MERVHIITYGNERFTNSKNRIRRELEAFGFLPTNIHVYGPEHIDPEFVAKTGLDWTSRGGGYYRWKPYVIYKTICEKMKPGDIGYWIDAGCTIRNNTDEQKRFQSYLEILKTREMIGFTDDVPECGWTKMEVFDYFDIKPEDPAFRLGQNGTCHFMFRVTDDVKKFFNQYTEVARIRPDLFNDDLTFTQYRGFTENRHDQSIYSCMMHLFKNREIILYSLDYGVVYVSRIRN